MTYILAVFALLHPERVAGSGDQHQSAGLGVMLLLVVPLIAWRMVKRFRRMVGRQRMTKARSWITLFMYPALILLIGAGAPGQLWLLAIGLAAGWLLGLFGLKKTVFEPTKEGFFYTPHAHIGIGLSVLFIARMGYRLIQVYGYESSATHSPDDFARSPLTLAVFGLLAGYYVTYAIGLLRWRSRVLRAKREREARQAAGALTPANDKAGEATS